MRELINHELHRVVKSRHLLVLLIVILMCTLASASYLGYKASKNAEETIQLLRSWATVDGNILKQNSLLLQSDAPLSERERAEIEEKQKFYSADLMGLKRLMYHYEEIDGGKEVDLTANLLEYNEHLLTGLSDGLVEYETIRTRKLKIGELELECSFLQHLRDNNIVYQHNPYELNTATMVKNVVRGEIFLLITVTCALCVIDGFLSEMREGGFKLLVTHQHTRSQVFTSKLLVAIVLAIALTLAYNLMIALIGFVLGGVGNLSYPIATRTSLDTLSLAKASGSAKMLATGLFIQKGLLGGIVTTVTYMVCALLLCVTTNSASKSSNIVLGIAVMMLAMISLSSTDNIVQLLSPFSYHFQFRVLTVSMWSNYYLGLLLNLMCSAIGIGVSYIYYCKTDFQIAYD